MSTQHTPGPWAISKIANHYDDYSIYSETENPQYNIASSVRGKTNAILMSAAPQLLEALQSVFDHAGGPFDDSHSPYFTIGIDQWRKVQDAICAATNS